MFKKERPEGYTTFNLMAVFAGTMMSIVISILGMAIIGIVFHLTTISERALPMITGGLFFLSVFLGAAFTARKAGGKALYHGVCAALVFFVLWWGTTFTYSSSNILSPVFFHKLLITFISGILGSFFGAITSADN